MSLDLATLWTQGDALNRAVAVLLLCMSVLGWVVIFYKSWLLVRARRSIVRSLAAFWQAPDTALARIALQQHDPLHLLAPLADAARPAAQTTVAASASRSAQLTRTLRNALHASQRQLQWGQIVLATIGSTAPFVGLLGTVWGIYHALTSLAGTGAISIDKVAAPVGEALIMTAFGLMVAIPAVMAYNIFGRMIAGMAEQLDGFAHDLLALHGDTPH